MQANLQKRENTQTTILALLVARKGGCTPRQLDLDYYELEGEHIPWKNLGYTSLLSFLHSMSKNVQIENKNNTTIIKGIASEKSKHVSQLIAYQKDQKQSCKRKTYKPSHYYPKTAPPRIHIPAEILSKIINLVDEHPDGINKNYVLREIQLYMPFANISMNDMEEQLRELSHKMFQRNNMIHPIQNKDKDSDCLKQDNDINPIRSKFTTHNNEKHRSVIITAAGNEDSDDMHYDNDSFEFTHDCTSRYVDTKAIMKPKSTSSFIKETISKCQGKETNPTITTEIEHNSSINNVESETKLDDNEKEDEETYLCNKNVDILVNKRVKFRLEKLIQKYFDGIWCADLPEKYLEEYKVPLNYIELGFNSVREFASELPEIFHCIQLHNAGDFKLYYAKNEIPAKKIKRIHQTNNLRELYHTYETSDEEALPTAVSLDTCKILIPDEVMTIGEYVDYINVAHLAESNELFLEVIVVEVFTPSFFWIQLRKKQKVFTKFMNDLNDFYSVKYEQYVIPPVVLEKGLNCACMYNGIWHRGIIKTVKPDFRITVMFYDYGTLKTYLPEEIYYLHKRFSTLPAQAIPCGLVNIRPVGKGSKWSRIATHNFALRTSQIPLIATIASVNKEDNSMMMTLTDTLEEEDVHINDWLVEQKLAEHGKMVCMKKRNFPFHHYLECQERIKQQKCSKICKAETNSKNNAALYNFNSDVDLSHSNNSLENVFPVKKKCDPALNYVKKSQTKLECLYEELLNFKLKSIRSKINNDNNNQINETAENTELLDSNLALSILLDQEPHKESVKQCHDNEAHSSSIDSHNKKDNEYDIFKRHSNIPIQYANHFHTRDPEDELDISCVKTAIDACNEGPEMTCTDYSVMWKKAIQEKKCILEKSELKIPHETMIKKRDIPLAENCFLKAVYNSSCYALHDKDIQWSPSGNINKMQDVSPLILRNIEKRRKTITNNMTVAIPKQILEILTDEHSMSSLHKSENTNEVQSINTSHEINTVSADNFKYTSVNETVCTKSSEYYSDYKGNDYINMKILSSKQNLLEKLLSIKDVTDNILNLDSDDLSTSEKTVSSDYNIDNNDVVHKKDGYENEINIKENILNETYSNIGVKYPSHSIKVDTINFHTQESLKSTINDLTVYEKETSATSSQLSETSALINHLKLPEDLSIEPILVQQSTSITESDSIKNVNCTEKLLLQEGTSLNVDVKESVETLIQEPLVIKETVQANVESAKESFDITKTSSIPVFNDIDIELDGEEWDIQVSYDDIYNFKSFNNSIQDRYDREKFDSSVKIAEMDDSSSIEGTNEITEGDIYEVLHSNKFTDQEVCTNVDQTKDLINHCEKTEIQMSTIDSEKNSEISNKCMVNPESIVSYELKGKARTLVKMMNKLKLLQKDY